MFERCHGSRHQELSLTEKTVSISETEAGGLLSCDVDFLSQEIRNGEKSGRVREKVGLKLDLAGQGAASGRRQQRARAWVGAWGGAGGGGGRRRLRKQLCWADAC